MDRRSLSERSVGSSLFGSSWAFANVWRRRLGTSVGPTLAMTRGNMGTLVSKRDTRRSAPPPPPASKSGSALRGPVAIRPELIGRPHSQRPGPPSSAPPPSSRPVGADTVGSPSPRRFGLPTKRGIARAALIATALTVVVVAFWPVRAEVVAVSVGPAAEIVYATGTVEKENRIQLKVKPGGTVTEIVAHEGQVVRQGDVLARLENPKVTSEAKTARLQLEIARRRNRNVSAGPSRASSLELQNAQRDFDNTRRLVASGTLAQKTLHDAELRLAHVRAGYNAVSGTERKESSNDAVEQLEGVATAAARAEADLQIKAPFDGIVLQNLLRVGDLVAPGEPAIGFARNTEPVASVFVDEVSVGRIQARTGDTPGSLAIVTVLALDRRTFQGEVIEIASEAERTLRTFRVKVRLLEVAPELRSGMSVEANIVSRKHDGALLVPTEGLDHDTVWVLDGLRARKVAVRIGIRDLELSEIEAGLGIDARVIVRPETQLRDGMFVWAR